MPKENVYNEFKDRKGNYVSGNSPADGEGDPVYQYWKGRSRSSFRRNKYPGKYTNREKEFEPIFLMCKKIQKDTIFLSELIQDFSSNSSKWKSPRSLKE